MWMGFMDVLKSYNKTLWVDILWLLAHRYWLNAVGNYVFVLREEKKHSFEWDN